MDNVPVVAMAREISVSKKPWLEASAYASTILATAATAIFIAAPPAHAFAVSAVFPPWWSAADVQRAVEPVGVTATVGKMPNIVTVYGGADLQHRLRKAGVWLFLDPRLINCGAPSETAT